MNDNRALMGITSDRLHVPTREEARRQHRKALLDAAKVCPFCGSTNLVLDLWILDDGEVDAFECADCAAGAPVRSWQKRTDSEAA